MILSLVEQHASDAAFLWFRREGATRAPHHTLLTLCDVDERLQAHLDGLRVAGAVGTQVALAALADEEPGAVFVAAVLSVGTLDLQRFAELLDLASADPARLREIVSALGWLPWQNVAPLLPGFFDAGC